MKMSLPLIYRDGFLKIFQRLMHAAPQSFCSNVEGWDVLLMSEEVLPAITSLFNSSFPQGFEAIDPIKVRDASDKVIQKASTAESRLHLCSTLLVTDHRNDLAQADLRVVLEDFVESLSSGTLTTQTEVLFNELSNNWDFCYSEFETLIVLFFNRLHIESTGECSGIVAAKNRVAQQVLEWNVDGYMVVQPFEDWERER